MLDGSVHREERVGDDFEAAGGFGEEGIRAEGGDPCGFHLRQTGDLTHPLSTYVRTGCSPVAELAGRDAVEPVGSKA